MKIKISQLLHLLKNVIKNYLIPLEYKTLLITLFGIRMLEFTGAVT